MSKGNTEAATQIFHPLPDEYKAKIDRVCDFVESLEDRIKKEYKKYYTPKEAAEFLNMSVRSLLNHKDELNPRKEGRIVVYHIDDLEPFWERRKNKM